MAHSVPRSRLLLQSSVSSELGAVSLAGYLRHSRGVSLNRMRTYGKYALVYLLEGSGRMRSGKQPPVPCHAGDLLFLYPEIPHGYGPGPGEIWSEIYLVFHGPIFDLWRRAGLLNPREPIRRLPRISQWLPQLERIVDRRLPDTPEGMLRRVCRLQSFLGEIGPKKAPGPVLAAPWLEAAQRTLTENPDLEPAVIARQLGLSYETFRKEFAAHTGHPPARYRALRLIDQARVLLAERSMSHKEIAETLGFYDEFHFSHRFQQLTGMTPKKYRQQRKRHFRSAATRQRRIDFIA
jgi:AraC-like DNA-binding protein